MKRDTLALDLTGKTCVHTTNFEKRIEGRKKKYYMNDFKI